MPKGSFKSILSVSSEDPAHPASNLLGDLSTEKKWKTKEQGEKSAYVILQFEKREQITGIDIGNEHSAFIEVLVARNGSSTTDPKDFKEILLTCSLMTPRESRDSTVTNRVRCFAKNSLVEGISDEKWDFIKIVCTQPFNRHVQYGLSFITIHVTESKTNGVPEIVTFTQKPNTTNENTSDSESESPMSLFQRWKKSKNDSFDSPKQQSTASAIREACTSNFSSTSKIESYNSTKRTKLDTKKENPKDNIVQKPLLNRNRDEILFGADDDEDNDKDWRNEKLEKEIAKDRERLLRETEENKALKTLKNEQPDLSSPSSSGGQKRRSSTTTLHDDTKKAKTVKDIEYRPFSKLLDGVVLVISGIQNPERADLRRKASELGAKYRFDWDNHCTHLICAFKNTPKYKQVKGNGKIVVKSWIEKCYSLRKRLPWRRFAIDGSDVEISESEDEIHDESLKNPSSSVAPPQSSAMDALGEGPMKVVNRKKNLIYDDSSSDTEEELERVRELQKNKLNGRETATASTKIPGNLNDSSENSPKKRVENIFDQDTDDEQSRISRIESLSQQAAKKFFNERNFFICDDIEADQLNNLQEIVTKFGGKIIPDMEIANFVLTNEKCSKNIQGEIVNPLWILECNEMSCFVPTRRYKID